MKYIFISLLYLAYTSCNNNSYNTITPIPVNFAEDSLYKRTNVQCNNLPKILRDNKFNYNLGAGLLEVGNNGYLIFKGKNYFLSFLNINNFNDTTKEVYKSFYSSNYFRLTDSFLVDFNRRSNTFYIYKIEPMLSLKLIDSLIFDDVDKKRVKHPRTEHLSTNFLYNNNKLIVNYSLRKGNNFIDDFALCAVEDGKKKFIGKYPEKYLGKTRIRNTNTLFAPVNDSLIVMGFTESDELTVFNYDNTEINRIKLSNDTSFIQLDKSKEKNLAYIDKLIQTNEKNVNLFQDKKGNLLFFKLERKPHKDSPNSMICFVMDANLKPKFKFKLNGEVFPYFIFKYENGFIVFSKKIDGYDYYEIM
jgi:hypothetical protein